MRFGHKGNEWHESQGHIVPFVPNFIPFQYINLKLSTDILLCGDIDMVQMDQQTAIDFICDQRLDMLEMLGELEEKTLCTLRNMTTGSGVQDLSEVMFNYRSIQICSK